MSKGESIAPRDLKRRTQDFALRVIRMVRVLPKSQEGAVLGKQVLRSATSVGANYRSAQRGKSKADFIAKLAIAEEEADESCYWLELIIAAELLKKTAWNRYWQKLKRLRQFSRRQVRRQKKTANEKYDEEIRKSSARNSC